MKKIRTISLILAMLLLCVSMNACSLISINTGDGGPATDKSAEASSKQESKSYSSSNSSSSSKASSKASSSSAKDTNDTNSREVKFKDDAAKDDWSVLRQERYVYYWSDSNNQMTDWPGKEMKKDSAGYFTYTIPSGASYIIFSEGSDLYQTVDIPFDGSVTEYQLTGERDSDGKYLVETWDGGSIGEATGYDTTKSISDSEVGISIEGVSIEKDYFKGSFSTNGGLDGVIFKIKNNLDVAVKSVTLYVAFLDSDSKAINTILGSYGDSAVASLTTNDTIIQPGETKEVAYSCNAEGVEREEYIVAAYTTTDRIQYENVDASAWASRY